MDIKLFNWIYGIADGIKQLRIKNRFGNFMNMEGMHASVGDTFRGREYAERKIINVERYSEVV